MFERFNAPARLVTVESQEFARQLRSQRIGTQHLLLALATSVGSDSSAALRELAIDTADLESRTRRATRMARRPAPAHIPFSDSAKAVIRQAVSRADMRRDFEVGTSDLLLSLAGLRYGEGHRILADLGVSYDSVRAAVESASQARPPTRCSDVAAGGSLPKQPAQQPPSARTPDGPISRVQCSEIIHAPADRVWPVIASPQAWSLRRGGCFVFDVPHSDGVRLQLTVGLHGLGTAVFKVRDVIADQQITIERVAEESRAVYTLSVAPGKKGSTRVDVCVTQSVPKAPVPFDESQVRIGLSIWLRALRDAIESQQLPADMIPAAMQSACLALKRLEQSQAVVATALIATPPIAVWDTIRSTAPIIGDQQIYTGNVPGSPIGEVGELQYSVDRLPSEPIPRSCIRVVTEYEEGRRMVLRSVPPWDEVTFSLGDEDGQTRLELLYRKRVATRDEQAEAAHTARWVQSLVDAYKVLAEGAAAT